MEKRTAEIIMICKGRHDFGEELSSKDAIGAYLAFYCALPLELVTEDLVNRAIWDAAIDYIDNIKDTPPGAFLQTIKEAYDMHQSAWLSDMKPIDWYEAVCVAFNLVSVKHGNRFINGFTEENTQFVSKNYN